MHALLEYSQPAFRFYSAPSSWMQKARLTAFNLLPLRRPRGNRLQYLHTSSSRRYSPRSRRVERQSPIFRQARLILFHERWRSRWLSSNTSLSSWSVPPLVAQAATADTRVWILSSSDVETANESCESSQKASSPVGESTFSRLGEWSITDS